MADEAADWKKKMKQQDNGIKLKDKEITQKNIQEYATTKTYTYKIDDKTDINLQELFQEDFRGWTKDTFNNLKTK